MPKYTDITLNEKLIQGSRQENYWSKVAPGRRRNANSTQAGASDRFQSALKGQKMMRELLEDYNLKGFEFGNWVEQDSREDALFACKKSLGQLASLFSTRNIGIDCNVGIAFGARGMGKADAHYEPSENMINMTKEHGSGALAHEYGHALDYNLGAYLDQNGEYVALSGGWSTASTLEKNLGGQLRHYVNAIVDRCKQNANSTELPNSDYWHRRTEVFARFFEQYVCYKLMRQGKQNLYLTNDWKYYITSKAYLSAKDFLALLPLGDKLCSTIGSALNDRLTLQRMPYPTITKPKAAAKTAKTTGAATKTATKASSKAADIMKEYRKFHNEYGNDVLVLFRNLPYYELFEQDAVKASKVLGIAVKKKDGISYVRFNKNKLDASLPKLVRAGYRVGLADLPKAKAVK